MDPAKISNAWYGISILVNGRRYTVSQHLVDRFYTACERFNLKEALSYYADCMDWHPDNQDIPEFREFLQEGFGDWLEA